VREQLANLSAPSDAVGKTSAVTGSIVVSADGKIVSDLSKITVDLASLQSDSGMRDRFVLGNTLQTSTFPPAVFGPTEIQGLSAPLPTSGQQTFQLVGNLTIHGVTKQVTWAVTSQVQGNDLTGQATTRAKFGDFGMTQPKVASVLSVTDDIRLEISFHLTKGA
jgi:polyisoprenoid-binding protein YceI